MSGYTSRRTGRAGHIMDHDRGLGHDAIAATVTSIPLGKLKKPVKQKKMPGRKTGHFLLFNGPLLTRRYSAQPLRPAS